MIIDPESTSALQLFVNGNFVTQLPRPPAAVSADTFDVVLGPSLVESASTAPTILYDNIVVDRATKPACK